MSNTQDNNLPDSGASDRDEPDECAPSTNASHSSASDSSAPDSDATDEDDSCRLSVPIGWDDAAEPILDDETIVAAVRAAAAHRGFSSGEIGVLVTTDPEIRQINCRHLQHDYATDVISFGYESDRPHLIGELVVSVDTAIALAEKVAWPATSELLLYIVHGVLHITGMEDNEPESRLSMRRAEIGVMLELGIDQITQCGADRDFGSESASESETATVDAVAASNTPEVSP